MVWYRLKIKEDFFKMKKALAILLVVAMAFGAFADDPAANFSLNTFSGSAKVEWVQNLDTNECGFNNFQNIELWWNMITAGSKATSGDGVWGELVIKNNDISRKADFTLVGGGDDSGKFNQGTKDSLGVWVETAKIHFVQGDVNVALNILNPDLDLGQGAVTSAINVSPWRESWVDDGNRIMNPETNVNENAMNAGFGIDVSSNLVDAFFKVKDNGVAKDKKWGFAAGTTIKPIADLAVSAAFAYANDATPIRVGANYKVNFNDEGSLYLKPAVDFTLNGDAKDLLVGAFFGWGAEWHEKYLYYINEQTYDYWMNTVSDGLSVAYKSDLADNSLLYVSLFDSTLVDGLNVGAVYEANVKEIGKGRLEAAAHYATDIDIITLELNAGFDGVLGNMDASAYKYGVKISTDDVVDNTTLYVDYTGNSAAKKGIVKIGANIAL